jgi:hypothetical protein
MIIKRDSAEYCNVKELIENSISVRPQFLGNLVLDSWYHYLYLRFHFFSETSFFSFYDFAFKCLEIFGEERFYIATLQYDKRLEEESNILQFDLGVGRIEFTKELNENCYLKGFNEDLIACGATNNWFMHFSDIMPITTLLASKNINQLETIRQRFYSDCYPKHEVLSEFAQVSDQYFEDFQKLILPMMI